jgi:hypothetical protein
MQEQVQSSARSRLANPLLDFATAMAEAQLKFWQTFHMEGTAFFAKRMRADMEYLRSLGHCANPQSFVECQWAWLTEARKDYAEEWARLAGTPFALGVSETVPMGSVFKPSGPRAANTNASNGLAPAAEAPRASMTK